jgi:hypothetical protein
MPKRLSTLSKKNKVHEVQAHEREFNVAMPERASHERTGTKGLVERRKGMHQFGVIQLKMKIK